MKLRAIGTGSQFCRHPLVTGSFLIQSETSNVMIGCGPNVPAKIESISLSIDAIDMWLIQHPDLDHIGGLAEVAALAKQKSFLAAPAALLSTLETRFEILTGHPLSEHFTVRATSKVTISEEHFSEQISFVPNYWRPDSYALLLEEASVFISGRCPLNEEFLHAYGAPAHLILHECSLDGSRTHGPSSARLSELQTLPLYLQQKTWLYGYQDAYLEEIDPIPMLFLPQGTCVYDSARKEKHLEKERFIRENSRRQIGNQKSQ